MREPHGEGVASRSDPESCVVVSKGGSEALTGARPGWPWFVVRLEDGSEARGRRLLFACGVCDELPAIDGLAEHWGKSVLHCAYCHGYEFADQQIAILACGQTALDSAATLLK